MTDKIKARFSPSRSLSSRMLVTVIFGLFTSAAVFFLVYYSGKFLVNSIYMSSENINKRKAEIYYDFSAFIADEKIRSSDSAKIAEWTEDKSGITILVFDAEGINFRAGGGIADLGKNVRSDEMLKYSEQYGTLYPVRFSDGFSRRIAIIDSSQQRQYTISLIIAIGIAFCVFLVFLLRYAQNLTVRIIAISGQAAVIGKGNLDAPIKIDGNDEVAELAAEIDRMRHSVIEKMSDEQQAWQANSDLITAISHDIRTPMTSLLGYLGLLNETGPSASDNDRALIASSYGKALELKDLTDELFRYFLIFGKSDVKLDKELFDAPLLIDQLLSEAEYDLTDSGFTVDRRDCKGSGSIQADALYLKRVTDNFVSNIKKYADSSSPVVMSAVIDGNQIHLEISNRISNHAGKAESNKIGLRTCRKIMELMGGEFSAEAHDGTFTAGFSLPIIHDNDT